MIKITIVTTQGCSHCQHAKTVLDKLKPEYNLTIEEIDATSEKGQELIQQHNIISSPGILINDRFFSMGGVTEKQLRDKFEELKKEN